MTNPCCGDDGDLVTIYTPGPPGPSGAIVDVGTRTSPVLVTSSIAVPLYGRQRSFLAGNAVPSVDPALPNGSNTMEWYLFGCSDGNYLVLNSTTNLQLSGEWVGVNGSVLCLHWDNVSKWVEAHRNEI